MSKSTRKFLRMKSYLRCAASEDFLRGYRLKLEDWRDCQALMMSGFKMLGTSEVGTYFVFDGVSEVVKNDLERLSCLKSNQ